MVMEVAQAYAGAGLDDIKAALAGGKLVVYSIARPLTPDDPVERSEVLVTYTFASPAFNGDEPAFAENPAVATGIGTPNFARAFNAEGAVVADFSAGPGKTEVKLSEVSASANYPIAVTKFTLETQAAVREETLARVDQDLRIKNNDTFRRF